MPHWYTSGSRVNAPEAIQRLPIQLQAENYPAQPAEVAYFAEKYIGGAERPVYVPRRQGYTRWTHPRQAFGSNVVSMLEALKQSYEFRKALLDAALGDVPTTSIYRSANSMGANTLPEPPSSARDLARVPLARNALPLYELVDPEEIIAASTSRLP